MNLLEAINRIAEDSGVTLSTISIAMGHGRNYINSTLPRGRCPSFDNANDMVRAAGYTVCFVRQGEEPEGAIIVDETLNQKKLTAKEREEKARRERERRRNALLSELKRLDELDAK